MHVVQYGPLGETVFPSIPKQGAPRDGQNNHGFHEDAVPTSAELVVDQKFQRGMSPEQKFVTRKLLAIQSGTIEPEGLRSPFWDDTRFHRVRCSSALF